MLRRSIMAAAAALALIAIPTAAMAYEAPPVPVTVSDATPSAGEPITFSVTGKADEALTLTITSAGDASAIEIAGTKSLTKTADAAGVATFTVKLADGGNYTLVATDASGAVLGTQVVTVAAGATTASLPQTGVETGALAAGAGVLVLAGAGAVLIARRRQTAVAGV